MENRSNAPGEDALRNMFAGSSGFPDSTSKADTSLVKSNGGGLSGAARKTLEDRKQAKQPAESAPEAQDYPTTDSSSTDSKSGEESAVLSDSVWIEPDTLFNEEAEVSVKVTTPPDKDHITKVLAELFAKTSSGHESISKGEGHAQADGKASIMLPVYKPKGYKDGLVEYFVEFSHKLAKLLSTEKLLRKVTDTALKSADHELVSGISFEKNTSYISPRVSTDLKKLEVKFQDWDKKYPKGQIVVFGHADQDEADGKGLSERRAQSAYAFITNDAATWEKLYNAEKWGLKPIQELLKEMGHYSGNSDGQDGPKTQAAIKSFQKKAGIPESGKVDASTRTALFSAYMKGKHDIKIEPSRFRNVASHPWMGCSQNNQVKGGPAAENRRVTFILINPSKYFPVYYPCQDGNEAACKGQCKKDGMRSSPGIRCLFYDELVREKQQEPVTTSPEQSKSNDEPVWMLVAKKEIGVTEIREKGKDNPRIVEYHQTTSLKATNDETAWCAAFVNWCLTQVGIEGMGSALAQDWLNWGRPVSEPIYGAVCCVYFEDFDSYHVGFVAGVKGAFVLLLGGNQSHGWKVSISQFEKAIVKGYRLPLEYKGPDIEASSLEGTFASDNAAGTR